jgi:hypothetical protein
MTDPTLAELLAHLQTVRDALDDADRVPFGSMGNHLDKMAVELDHAINCAEKLEDELK